MLRAKSSTQSFYKNSCGNSSSFESSRAEAGNLSGRLVFTQPSSEQSFAEPRVNAQSPCGSRVFTECRKILPTSDPKHCLHRGTFPTRQSVGVADCRENSEYPISSQKDSHNTDQCSRFSSFPRPLRILHTVNSTCSVTHAPHTNSSSIILEPSIPEIGCQNSCYSQAEISSEVVFRYL